MEIVEFEVILSVWSDLGRFQHVLEYRQYVLLDQSVSIQIYVVSDL